MPDQGHCDIRRSHRKAGVPSRCFRRPQEWPTTLLSFCLSKSGTKHPRPLFALPENNFYFPSVTVSVGLLGTFEGDFPAFVVQDSSRAKLSSPSQSFIRQMLLSTNSTSSP